MANSPDSYVEWCAGRMRYLFGEYLRDHGMGNTESGTTLDWREERIVNGLLYAVAGEMHSQRLAVANPLCPPHLTDSVNEARALIDKLEKIDGK